MQPCAVIAAKSFRSMKIRRNILNMQIIFSSGDAQTEVIALVIDSIVYMSERRFKLITCVEVKMFTTTG